MFNKYLNTMKKIPLLAYLPTATVIYGILLGANQAKHQKMAQKYQKKCDEYINREKVDSDSTFEDFSKAYLKEIKKANNFNPFD